MNECAISKRRHTFVLYCNVGFFLCACVYVVLRPFEKISLISIRHLLWVILSHNHPPPSKNMINRKYEVTSRNNETIISEIHNVRDLVFFDANRLSLKKKTPAVWSLKNSLPIIMEDNNHLTLTKNLKKIIYEYITEISRCKHTIYIMICLLKLPHHVEF